MNHTLAAGDTLQVMTAQTGGTTDDRVIYCCETDRGTQAIFSGTPSAVSGTSVELLHVLSGTGLGAAITGQMITKGVLVGGAAAGTAYVLYESYRLCREWLSSSPVLDAANDMASRLIAAGLDPLKPSPVPLGIRIAWKGFEKTLERVVLGESPAEKWRRYSEGQD